MSSNVVPFPEQPIEWLSWSKAIGLLMRANVGYRAKVALADWCAQGLIETKASLLTGGGEVRRDVELEPELWGVCWKMPHLMDGLNGAIIWTPLSAVENGEGGQCRVIGPMFRKDQLLAMVSHVPPEEIEAVLAPGGGWMERNVETEAVAPQAIEPPPTITNRGRKPEKARWTAFWLAAVELGRDGRLQRGGFNSAQELGDELLLMMGDGAFSYDHVKAEVGQIYKNFVGD